MFKTEQPHFVSMTVKVEQLNCRQFQVYVKSPVAGWIPQGQPWGTMKDAIQDGEQFI